MYYFVSVLRGTTTLYVVEPAYGGLVLREDKRGLYLWFTEASARASTRWPTLLLAGDVVSIHPTEVCDAH